MPRRAAILLFLTPRLFDRSRAGYTEHVLPRQVSSACCCILTRRASEGSASEPALARRKICETLRARYTPDYKLKALSRACPVDV